MDGWMDGAFLLGLDIRSGALCVAGWGPLWDCTGGAMEDDGAALSVGW